MKADGFFDFIGLGPTSKTKNAKGTRGANEEIGSGLYVTDDKFMYVSPTHPERARVLKHAAPICTVRPGSRTATSR